MSKSIKSSLAAAAAATLLFIPALSCAELVASAAPGPAVAAPHASALAALDFLTEAVSHGASASDPSESAAETRFADDERAYKLGVGRLIAPPAHLRGDVDLFLWNLLALVHAHRDGKHFELAERGVEFVLSNHPDQPSAVPLPGAMWLFVMGILGLAGTRITGVRGAAGTLPERSPGMLPGAAVPA